MTEPRPLLYPGPRTALLRRVTALTVDELHSLDAAIRALAAEKEHKRGRQGLPVRVVGRAEGRRRREPRARGPLLRRPCCPRDRPDRHRGRAGRGAGLPASRRCPISSCGVLMPPRPSRQLQDVSIGLIEDHLAPWDPRLAIVATWNMACAATLRDHIPAATITVLEAPLAPRPGRATALTPAREATGRSAGLPADHRPCDTRRRRHPPSTPPPGGPRDLEHLPGLPVLERDRGRARCRRRRDRRRARGLERRRSRATSSPLDAGERWWTYHHGGCGGTLHAAGYARDSTRCYVVCDRCGKTALR